MDRKIRRFREEFSNAINFICSLDGLVELYSIIPSKDGITYYDGNDYYLLLWDEFYEKIKELKND